MKRIVLTAVTAALCAFGAAHAQVGTTLKEAGKTTVQSTEEAGQAVAGAVTSGPRSARHKAKARAHRRSADVHAARTRAAARNIGR